MHKALSFTKHQPASFLLLFLTHKGEKEKERQGDMSKTLLCSLKAAHVNHLLGPCQQPKGFNGTVFWDLHVVYVVQETESVRGDGKRKDLSECHVIERRHGVRREGSCFSPFILCSTPTPLPPYPYPPPPHTQMQTHSVSFSHLDVLSEIGLGAR